MAKTTINKASNTLRFDGGSGGRKMETIILEQQQQKNPKTK